MEADTRRLGHLKWLCRRGLKELDVLLESFLKREADRLAAGGWPEFESFLAQEDDRLWDVLQACPADQTTAWDELIRAIRQTR